MNSLAKLAIHLAVATVGFLCLWLGVPDPLLLLTPALMLHWLPRVPLRRRTFYLTGTVLIAALGALLLIDAIKEKHDVNWEANHWARTVMCLLGWLVCACYLGLKSWWQGRRRPERVW